MRPRTGCGARGGTPPRGAPDRHGGFAQFADRLAGAGGSVVGRKHDAGRTSRRWRRRPT